MKLKDLKIGDKFRFPESSKHYNYGRPYLIIDFNLYSIYPYSDINVSQITPVLDLVTYKIVGFNKEFEVEQDKDNIPV